MIITEEGYNKLLDEKQRITNIDLVKATTMLEETRPIGVSDEFPPEYLLALDNMNRIEKKLSDLSSILSSSTIFNPSMIKNKNKVGFGATVSLERDDGKCLVYKIVSSYESDISNGLISIDSPLVHEMLQLSVDDFFDYNNIEYTITKITY